MVKYILKRLILGLCSACIVSIIVMVMIYSLMDRTLIFAADPTYSKYSNNAKTVYKYEKWDEYGYGEYLSYEDYLTDLEKAGEIDPVTHVAAYQLGKEDVDMEAGEYIAEDDGEVTKIYLAKYGEYCTANAFTIYRLNRVMISKTKVASGGEVKVFAFKDKSLLDRIGSFFGNMFHLDNVHYATEVTGERGISFTWNDPAYGGSFAPAIIGNGTQYKYMLYFDSQFPFIHSNLLTIHLGTSYSVNKGVDVWATMTTPQGSKVTQITYFPSGVVEESSDNLHTLEYVEGSYSPTNPTVYRRFVDDYTSCDSTKAGKSQMGYSFLIGIIATLIAYIIGLPLGILMAKHKGKIADKLGTIYIVFIIAVPSLAYIFMFKIIGGTLFNLPQTFYTDSEHVKMYGNLVYILPIVSLALPSIAGLMQWTRRYMIDQINSDYVRFARAGGLSEGEIFSKHIFKNAAIPIVHGIPGAIIGALTGAIITERVYSVPGVGNVLTNAINKYDNSVIVGVTFFYAILSVISILLGDILMAIMDPRINFNTKER